NAGTDMHDRAARADVYNSPGWKRMQAHRSERRAPKAAAVTIDAEAAAKVSGGGRGSHAKFGGGPIIGIARDTLTSQFGANFKTVKAAYIQPADGHRDVPF